MIKTYDETFTVLTRDCDLKGTWRLSAVLETMQEVAGAHSFLLGCGREELLKKNIVWVLSRSELHMERYPRAGEKITIHTFPMPNRICFFPRYYIFTDERGEMVGKAGTLWLLLDVETRKMLPPGDIANLIPDNRDLAVPMNLPATVGNLQGEEFVSEYTSVFTDLDVNGHVNNTRYADWLCNTLGIDLMSRNEPETVILNYNHEVLPGQKLIFRKVLRDNHYRLTGYLGDTAVFDIGGTLRPVP
ncbi:MAG: hypothetical protein IJQ71_05750 [Clostridia bacterium]|jgi:acyl-ACP thioesterase|nr:hypothetical protein [Clostridia bacterium]